MFHHPVRDADAEADDDPPRDAACHCHSNDVWIHCERDLIGDEEEEDVHDDRREEREQKMQWEGDEIQEWS